MKNNLIILLTFLLLTAIFYAVSLAVPHYLFPVLMGGNTLMAALSLLTGIMVGRQLNERPEAFVRAVFGATFLKLMVCLTAILLYVLLYRDDIHKPTLFVLFGIYAAYTAVETVLLSRLAKQAKGKEK